ncbi:MAG: GDSL-type esterase/lipase family protein [Candidatus Adiutrix sp.]|jgi:lysophospholipase L1-like esterase|nr:GDSL-type esterase/lipase family protein [Candidatus Adiutrix sp.]
MTAEKRIVMLGDSLTAGHDWSRVFPGARVRNLGINGDTVAGVWGRLDDALTPTPDKIFVQIGINDFLRGATPDEIGDIHLRIWDEIRERSPQTALRVVSMLPFLEASFPGLPPTLELVWLNRRLADEAAQRGLVFIDLFEALADENRQLRLDYTSDGLHLLPEAYAVWAEFLQAAERNS